MGQQGWKSRITALACKKKGCEKDRTILSKSRGNMVSFPNGTEQKQNSRVADRQNKDRLVRRELAKDGLFVC